MKISINIILLIIAISSCQSQENQKEITLNYSAQTRGYNYTLALKNDTLKINNNQILKITALSEHQQKNLFKLISKIDFKKIKSTISKDNLAVDKAIKGVFVITINKQYYRFEFDHNHLPKTIKKLFSQLDEYDD